jgi:5-methylcytosine-specific restriction endonuclease McrA
MPDKRTYSDRKEYLKQAVTKRRLQIRLQAIQYKGGKCELCGYQKCLNALEFHHYKNIKNFGISQKGYTRSWEKVKFELNLCQLLCANCHREVESNN